MLDPGVMGASLVWLTLGDEVETRRDGQCRAVAVPRRKSSIRVTLAHGLRRAASAFDRPTISAVTDE